MKGTIVKTIAAVICGIALLALVSMAAASAASQHPSSAHHHRTGHAQMSAHSAYVVGEPAAKHDPPLPFQLNVTALAGVGGCLIVLGAWGFWQTKRRCTTCGYCPAFCGCDELAHH
jgi:hypothetical protein